MKLTDYVMQRLAEYGVRDIFLISGGGAMHLVDSVGKNKQLNYICTHHEQAVAIAAEGYTRASGKMGVAVVTTGPGGTNTMTGVIGQWLDSIPCLYISGQVKRETTIQSCPDIPLRQLGDQEIDIIAMVKPVAKYAVSVRDASEIRYHLEKAIHCATTGRPGPVWVDIPLDIQAATIDETGLPGYTPEPAQVPPLTGEELSVKAREVAGLLRDAKRPLVIAGHGIRLSGGIAALHRFLEHTGIPALTTFNGFDLVPVEHPSYAGRPGTLGTRFGNLALQNSDLILSVGTRNNIRQVSYNWKIYGRSAKKVVVDIDHAELMKPTLTPDVAVHADAREFLEALMHSVPTAQSWNEWRLWCSERKRRFPVVQESLWNAAAPVNPYCFVDALTAALPENSTVVAGNGTACVALFQAGIVKKGQRMFWNSGCASMGYDLPAAIGACFAAGKNNVVCLAGDGSLQMNIQELETMAFHQLPIKLFVLNNNGYVSIRQTQGNFFAGHYVACDPASGVGFPEMRKLASAYGIAYERIDEQMTMRQKIDKIVKMCGPVIIEVMLDPDHKFSPRVSSFKRPDGSMVSKPLEDMYPFLSKEELQDNMLVELLPESL